MMSSYKILNASLKFEQSVIYTPDIVINQSKCQNSNENLRKHTCYAATGKYCDNENDCQGKMGKMNENPALNTGQISKHTSGQCNLADKLFWKVVLPGVPPNAA
ncbi:hypothetical protein B5X24_HaOG209179 [Helicoverpa armigera]|nr:hypothetical protein B5X24_HaOG209179 [Helicoverpa armigera]